MPQTTQVYSCPRCKRSYDDIDGLLNHGAETCHPIWGGPPFWHVIATIVPLIAVTVVFVGPLVHHVLSTMMHVPIIFVLAARAASSFGVGWLVSELLWHRYRRRIVANRELPVKGHMRVRNFDVVTVPQRVAVIMRHIEGNGGPAPGQRITLCDGSHHLEAMIGRCKRNGDWKLDIDLGTLRPHN